MDDNNMEWESPVDILKDMLNYDYGYPSYAETWALEYALKAIKERDELKKGKK